MYVRVSILKITRHTPSIPYIRMTLYHICHGESTFITLTILTMSGYKASGIWVLGFPINSIISFRADLLTSLLFMSITGSSKLKSRLHWFSFLMINCCCSRPEASTKKQVSFDQNYRSISSSLVDLLSDQDPSAVGQTSRPYFKTSNIHVYAIIFIATVTIHKSIRHHIKHIHFHMHCHQYMYIHNTGVAQTKASLVT